MPISAATSYKTIEGRGHRTQQGVWLRPTFSQRPGSDGTVLILLNEEINSFFIKPSGNHLDMAPIPLTFNFTKAQRRGKNVWAMLDRSLSSMWANE